MAATVAGGRPLCIRNYDAATDAARVEILERRCEAGVAPSRSATLYTDLLGDPLCRVRHFPAYAMLVAELQQTGAMPEIVGIIRAGVKEVVRSSVHNGPNSSSKFVCTAYISGLRVSPQHRRQGVAEELVKRMERWCREEGAEYTYIATEKGNEAAVRLFTKKLAYKKFRTPSILVHPAIARRNSKKNSKVIVEELSREKAEALYRSIFMDMEFFPKDIGELMNSRLHKGTWVAMWKGGTKAAADQSIVLGADQSSGAGIAALLDARSSCWAVLSLWRCNEIFKLQVKGAATAPARILALMWRLLARALPAGAEAPPDIFRPFGLQLVYGLHVGGEGGAMSAVVRELMGFAHRAAAAEGCAVVALEVASRDPLRQLVPSWHCLSCEEDLWCIKRLGEAADDEDWSEAPPPPSLFLDPRDF